MNSKQTKHESRKKLSKRKQNQDLELCPWKQVTMLDDHISYEFMNTHRTSKVTFSGKFCFLFKFSIACLMIWFT